MTNNDEDTTKKPKKTSKKYEIIGISWKNEDKSWCLEVDEETYKNVMGEENWAIEKLVRNRMPKDDHMPYKIQMDDLLGCHRVYYGNKVKLTIEIEKMKND